MPTDKQMAVRQTIQRRVELSAPMLKGMGIQPEVYERVALNALVRNPDIADCSRQSIDRALLDSIDANLVPDGRDAVIVPFKSRDGLNATFIPMIGGQVKLALAATPGLTLRSKLVYADDKFEYEEGLHPVLIHVPNPTADRIDGSIIAVYAVAHIPASIDPAFEVLLRGDIDRHRGYSRTGAKGPWNDYYGQMAQKTALRQLLKRLPRGVGQHYEVPAELEHIEIGDYDTRTVDVTTGEIIDVEPKENTFNPMTSKLSVVDGEVASVTVTNPGQGHKEPVEVVPQVTFADNVEATVQSDGNVHVKAAQQSQPTLAHKPMPAVDDSPF